MTGKPHLIGLGKGCRPSTNWPDQALLVLWRSYVNECLESKAARILSSRTEVFMSPSHSAVLCNFLVLAVCPAMIAQGPPPEPKSGLSNEKVTVIRAGQLIDPDSGTVLTDQEILIVGK